MIHIDKKELNKYLIISILTMLVAALCILKIGGLTAIITTVIYCILLGLTITGTLTQIFSSKAVGMGLGLAADPKTGKTSMDMNKYNQFIDMYEHRFSSIRFWVSVLNTMAWIIIFLVGGFPIISYIISGVYICSEIGIYRVYKAVKNNKIAWGAAAYVNEIRNFLGKKGEQNEG